jgi:hypothetical protein
VVEQSHGVGCEEGVGEGGGEVVSGAPVPAGVDGDEGVRRGEEADEVGEPAAGNVAAVEEEDGDGGFGVGAGEVRERLSVDAIPEVNLV